MTDYERVAKVIRYVDAHYLEQPSLSTLAGVAGLSESHFHRLFSRWAGVTPKDFVKFLTARHAKALLTSSRSHDVLRTALDSGLSGPGRLHDLLVSVEAMSPGELRAGGAGLEIRYGFHPTPFGDCLIALTARGVLHLAFDEKRAGALEELRETWPRAHFTRDAGSTAEALARVFGPSSRREPRKVSVLLAGTPFQLKVWQALLRVPPGAVVSYSDLARSIGSPGASRAVGSAVGANRIAYLIPCHRVIRETGAIGEYRWGSERKQALLAVESRSDSLANDSRSDSLAAPGAVDYARRK